MSDFQAELALSLDLASRAGTLASSFISERGAGVESTEKPNDGGPVTAADLAVNRLLVDALTESFPDDVILAEESAPEATRRGQWGPDTRVWMVDPIDGTREFSQGLDAWAVHIGLCVGGTPVLGVVARPALGQLLWGSRGAGAWIRDGGDERSLAAPAVAVENPRMISSASRPSHHILALAEALGIDDADRIRSGSTGVKMSRLALGEAELYPHASGGLKHWDLCAPQAILEASGGRVTDLRGQPLRYDSDRLHHPGGLLATRALDHASIVALIARIGDAWFDDGELV